MTTCNDYTTTNPWAITRMSKFSPSIPQVDIPTSLVLMTTDELSILDITDLSELALDNSIYDNPELGELFLILMTTNDLANLTNEELAPLPLAPPTIPATCSCPCDCELTYKSMKYSYSHPNTIGQNTGAYVSALTACYYDVNKANNKNLWSLPDSQRNIVATNLPNKKTNPYQPVQNKITVPSISSQATVLGQTTTATVPTITAQAQRVIAKFNAPPEQHSRLPNQIPITPTLKKPTSLANILAK